MSRIYLTALLVPLLLISIAIFSGCSKQPEVIMAVPLCDCTHNPEDPHADCWNGYVCEAGAACSHDGGQYDKCVPQGISNPQDHDTSY
jgi:hypothetical protein